MDTATLLPASVRDQFTRDVVYLNTASCGLPPRAAHEATLAVERDRAAGRLSLPVFDEAVERSRAAFARLVGVPRSRVAAGSQASQFVGLVAASLPPGATVVVAEEDFTSVTYPFVAAAERGVKVRPVPVRRIVDAVDSAVDLVAVSAAQSADGYVVDVGGLLAAASAHGARVLLDTTQSSGWLPIPADRVDYLVCSAYKWLLGPRGACFLAGTEEALADLTPIAANWFAAETVPESFYGTRMRLAPDARRFNVSPVWASWVGLAPALEMLADLGEAAIGAHNVALANRFCAGLGLPPTDSAIVSLEVAADAADALAAQDVIATMRAGRLRCAFHLSTDAADVDRAVGVVGGYLRG
ncbi:aminotransferase class V-fold PLP-dependent enzyme [Thermobifida halotolerans]|uniref:Aminotransferase class V-fold PLP-dependent enzyme n=1 Tax=Thermobifida halotolerans TaxID=483545 RepID=A0A399FWI0_9ACTN|nr:aminotransferase class V-fold PLP-dependent enzyme [Thermobifida halotolerans]UOE19060.1 aminotransferase class V-fold PLP-dependent enzyme [Thermobifida halotolerans]